MFTFNWRGSGAKVLALMMMIFILMTTVAGCRGASETTVGSNASLRSIAPAKKISEVSPPAILQELREALDIYRPQVSIISPLSEQILPETTVKVSLQVQDLPVFKNPNLEMGPHLNFILDNLPATPIYDLSQGLVLENLSPGTHTLRVFAARPWEESFKNEGAYAQTTFHILSKNFDNSPEPSLPLLTYSQPQGTYGAEPVLLDFYLTNAPLHLLATESSTDNIADWRIRVTVNGETFIQERWEPIYLKGFTPGKNWLQIEFLDEEGNSVKNSFNNTVREIIYDPKAQDSLSKILRGEISSKIARAIVDPYYIPPAVEPEEVVTPEEPVILEETPTLEIPTQFEQIPLETTPILETPSEVPIEEEVPLEEVPVEEISPQEDETSEGNLEEEITPQEDETSEGSLQEEVSPLEDETSEDSLEIAPESLPLTITTPEFPIE